MRFMNEYDIDVALTRYHESTTPNRARAAVVVSRLRTWANENSDGWCYWPKPARAAARLMALIDGGTWAEQRAREETDASNADLTAALAPVKAFLTRQGVAHDEVLA